MYSVLNGSRLRILAWSAMVVVLLWLQTCSGVRCAPGGPASPAHSIPERLEQQAEVIIICRIMSVAPTAGGFILSTALRGDHGPPVLKGSKEFAFWDVFVANSTGLRFRPGEDWILFTSLAPGHQRLALLPGPGARQPVEDSIVKQIVALAGVTAAVAITLTTDKESYRPEDPVVLVWRLKNQTALPLIIDTNVGAFDWDAAPAEPHVPVNLCANSFESWMSYNTRRDRDRDRLRDTRRPQGFRTLSPGQTYERRETIPALIPPGILKIHLAYMCKDANSGDRGVGTTAPRVFIAHEERNLQVTVEPVGDGFLRLAAQKLLSPVWEDQRSVAGVLAQDPGPASLPLLHALSLHPWAKIRELAAQGLAASSNVEVQDLRRLLFDPDCRVRDGVCRLADERILPHLGLSMLALKLVTEEGAARGFLKDETQESQRFDFTIGRLMDLEIGDLVATRVADGRLPVDDLIQMLGLGVVIGAPGPNGYSAAQKASTLAAWKDARAKVGHLWNEEDLKQEVDRCRKLAFNDFQLDTRLPRIQEIIHALSDTDFYDEKAYAELKAMGKSIIPTLRFVIDNATDVCHSEVLCRLLLEWTATETVDGLISQAYEGCIYAARTAYLLDPRKTLPQVEHLYRWNPGAAIVLASLGQKRAVPYVVPELIGGSPEWTEIEMSALARATGVARDYTDWQQWWEKTGKLQDWN